jgi:hypothetical protein
VNSRVELPRIITIVCYGSMTFQGVEIVEEEFATAAGWKLFILLMYTRDGGV